jgi:hypothetical protein
MADPATGDMIHNHPGALLKTPDSGTFLHNLATGFMAGNDPLVSLGALTYMFPVNGPDIAAADSTSLHLDQYLSVSRGWNWNILQNHRTISGKVSALHRSLHNLLLNVGS